MKQPAKPAAFFSFNLNLYDGKTGYPGDELPHA